MRKEDKKIYNFWMRVIVVISLLCLLRVVSNIFSPSKDDAVACDEMCLADRLLDSSKTKEKEIIVADKTLKAKTQEMLDLMVAKKKLVMEYNDIVREKNELLGLEVDLGTAKEDDIAEIVAKLNEKAEFLKFLDYEVPAYDTEKKVVFFRWEVTPERQRLMNIAYQLGGKDFVLTLQWENGSRDPTLQSYCHGPKCEGPESGKPREESYGLCQLHVPDYLEFYQSGFFEDPEKQLIFCRNEYKKALEGEYINSKFYAYKHRQLYEKQYNFSN